MLIIQRYVFREVSQSFAAVLLILLMMFLSHRFVRFLTDAAAGNIASELIFTLLALNVAALLAVLLPLALFVGVLLGLGRLHRDSELVAMAAGGVGEARITRYVLSFAGAVATFSLLFAVYLGPRLSQLQEAVLAEARGQAEVTGVVPGRFKEVGSDDQVIYVERISEDQREMQNVFVQLEHENRHQILVSEKAYLSPTGDHGERFVVMENGHRYEGRPGRADYIITSFEKHAVRIDRLGNAKIRDRLHTRNTADLVTQGMSDASPQVRGENWAELQWRLSLPISALLLGALAVPLARTSPRQGRYGGLLLGIVVYFTYSNLLTITRQYMESGDLSPRIGVWPVHLAVFAATWWLLTAPATRRRLWLRLRPTTIS